MPLVLDLDELVNQVFLRLIRRQTFGDNFEDRQLAIGRPGQRTTSDCALVGTVMVELPRGIRKTG